MKWITRERPKIDRIACPWLIKSFVDKEAEFIYVPFSEVLDKAKELGSSDLFALNPVILLVTMGGFITNAVYCLFQNKKNKTGNDYFKVSGSVLTNNVLSNTKQEKGKDWNKNYKPE